jgi:hypothetical protein
MRESPLIVSFYEFIQFQFMRSASPQAVDTQQRRVSPYGSTHTIT